MKNSRRLVLKKESLVELTTAELASVEGGATQACPTNYCAPDTRLCISRMIDPCVTGIAG
jgi:hypothetical protein